MKFSSKKPSRAWQMIEAVILVWITVEVAAITGPIIRDNWRRARPKPAPATTIPAAATATPAVRAATPGATPAGTSTPRANGN